PFLPCCPVCGVSCLQRPAVPIAFPPLLPCVRGQLFTASCSAEWLSSLLPCVRGQLFTASCAAECLSSLALCAGQLFNVLQCRVRFPPLLPVWCA
ncbi:hypothetical protein J6590_106873, partial [Homalodisca vitripennis]